MAGAVQDALGATQYTGGVRAGGCLRRWIALAVLVACTGARTGSLEPAADADPDPEEPVEADDVEAPPPAPDPYDGPLARLDLGLNGRLEPALILEIRQAKGAFDAASTSAEVAAAWRRALRLAPRLEGALQPAFEASNFEALDLAWLRPSLPAMSETYMAEGLALVFMLDSPGWIAKAAETEEPDDDAFFALMDKAWGAARALGWASWDDRTWDYGGCSGLGDGTVHDVLLLVDAAQGPHFADEVAETRRRALFAVLENNPQFPHCDVKTLAPTPAAVLRAEARAILADVTLSAQERAAIEARIPELVGEPHTGG